MTSREIAIELLKKWVENEIDVMCEYSYNFDESRKSIWKETQKYLKLLDSTDSDLENELKTKIFH